MLRAALIALLLPVLPAAAWAQPLTEREARRALFPAEGYVFKPNAGGGLTKTQLGYLDILFKSRLYRDELESVARYYGAIAVSPSLFQRLERGVVDFSGGVPFQFAEGYHSPRAAAQAAINDCAAQLGEGDAPCVIAAQLLPRRWKTRALSMSVLATEAFKAYRNADGPKAFAISPSTRAFAVKAGPGAQAEAVASCNAVASAAGVQDCQVVIADSQ